MTERALAAGRRRRAGGVLLLYHRPTRGQFVDAANVRENISAFGRHSRFTVWEVNVDLPLPPALGRYEFDAILLHYSVFVPATSDFLLPPEVVTYVERSSAYKIATFQDEYHHCGARFAFIDRVGIDCVYTMLEPPYDAEVYLNNSTATTVVSNLPAYVGEELLQASKRNRRPYEARTLDVCYRARPWPAFMGRGAREKQEIGERFAELAAGSGLSMDISVREADRIYGEDWFRFVASSRATLGVESGASCFDLRGEVREEFDRLTEEKGREPTIEEMEEGSLARWDWRIPYQTLSPRNLEAAALGVCQILYEGRYSGVMVPMHNYIPLRKDFSNLDEVIERFRDEALRRELAENARADLIESGMLGYERLIAGFDKVLLDAGLSPRWALPGGYLIRRRLRPPDEITRGERFSIAWQRLHVRRPVLWRILWALSRPISMPFRLLQRIRHNG
jgi:hypothetical protein